MNAPQRHSAFTPADALNLTAFMQANGIHRIYQDPRTGCFAIALFGGAYGNGNTAGEAFEDALAHREQLSRRAA